MNWLLPLIFALSPLVISHSGRIPAKTYFLPSQEGIVAAGTESIPTFQPAVIVRGDNLVVDFAGSVFRGSAQTAWPNHRQGLGIRVEGNNITLKNLQVHGYKVGLLAQNCRNLKILDSDFSYNWKQRLASTPEREDEGDWMSFHHNENQEWLRYGAGIYFDSCREFEIKGTKITGGQCGLMLTKCEDGKIWNNDFSFLSGIGLGLYRSSNNVVVNNRIDYDVRGFSYGVYNRGQDSAGILIFEQSNENYFGYNSVTHGGDGFFLWAGQHTMDTGEGGCNDNVVYDNDFSHAVTNGIEATFSRNRFVENQVRECFHGMWGGYSYDTIIFGNNFHGNQRAIAIEHGQKNIIQLNSFDQDDVAIALWAPPVDPNFAYAKNRDVRSFGNEILRNSFRQVALALDIKASTELVLDENVFDRVSKPTRISGQPFSLVSVANVLWETPDGTLPGDKQHLVRGHTPWDPKPGGVGNVYPKPYTSPLGMLPRQVGGMNAFMPKDTEQGWKTIHIDDWGPYDFRRPLIVPLLNPQGAVPLPGGTSDGSGVIRPVLKVNPRVETFQILGPHGRWKLLHATGVKLHSRHGIVPCTVQSDVTRGPVKVDLEFIGTSTTDIRGVLTPAGTPIKFSYEHFAIDMNWDIKFFRWLDSEDPANIHASPKDFPAVLLTKPIKELKASRLDFAGSSFAPGLPTDHYATLAEGTFDVPRGEYVLDLTTDDGARVCLDDKLLIEDAWKYQGPTLYSRTLKLTGRHHLRVEHFQIDGYAALKVGLRRLG